MARLASLALHLAPLTLAALVACGGSPFAGSGAADAAPVIVGGGLAPDAGDDAGDVADSAIAADAAVDGPDAGTDAAELADTGSSAVDAAGSSADADVPDAAPAPDAGPVPAWACYVLAQSPLEVYPFCSPHELDGGFACPPGSECLSVTCGSSAGGVAPSCPTGFAPPCGTTLSCFEQGVGIVVQGGTVGVIGYPAVYVGGVATCPMGGTDNGDAICTP